MKRIITIVVPVARMSGKLEFLESWLKLCDRYPASVFIIHDKWDETTGPQLKELVDRLSNPNISFFEDKFQSVGAARNFGLSQCKTEWIIFWDSDDLPDIDSLCAMILENQNKNIDMILGEYIRKNYPHGKEVPKPWSRVRMVCYLQFILNPGIWRVVFRRSVIENNTFPSLGMGEDQIFLASALAEIENIIFVKKNIYSYHTGIEGQATQDPQKLLQTYDAFNNFPINSATSRNRHRFVRSLMLAKICVSSLKLRKTNLIQTLRILLKKIFFILITPPRNQSET